MINSRYEVLRLLGKGGMGTVFLARDRHRGGREVALKRVRSDRLDARMLSTIRNEFLALADLSHPNVAGVYDFGLESRSKDIFFTSELVAGFDWMNFVRRLDLTTSAGMEVFLGSVTGVLRGLEFIHSRRIVHLDLKPDNVLVAKSERGGLEPRLIDFGLAKVEREFGGKRIMGTTYYIAPETILGARVDRRTDLYSLGVVLYHLVTGELPFRGKSNLEIFKGHLERSPVPPHELAEFVPRQLSTIILCLMEKKPTDRFQSALEVVDEFNRELGHSFPLETDESVQAYLDAAVSVGRSKELERLRATFCLASKTEPLGVEPNQGHLAASSYEVESESVEVDVPPGKTIILRGEPGIGKRRVITRLRHIVQTQGASFLEVECERDPGQVDDFLQFVRQLVVFANHAAEGGESTLGKRVVGLARRLTTEGTASVDAQFGEEVRLATTELLETSRSHPFSLHFHDLHLASGLLLGFVKGIVECLASERVFGARVLVSASTLEPVDIEDTALHDLYAESSFRKAIRELHLNRLDAEGVSRMVEAAFVDAEFPDSFPRRVLEESDGNPEVVLDILEFFIQNRIIYRDPYAWILKADYPTKSIPGRVRTELKSRIQGLPKPAYQLALAFAVLGGTAELDLAARVANLSDNGLDETVGLLRRERVLQERMEGDVDRVYSIVHSTTRDVLYRSIDKDRIAAQHGRVGELCEEYFHEKGACPNATLAYHFLRARHRDKGVQYGVAAAREHAASFQPAEAADLYERVLALLGDEDPSAWAIRRELGRVRLDVGEYLAALQALEPLLLQALEPVDRDFVRLDLALAHGRLGHYEEAARLTQEVITSQADRGDPEIISDLLVMCADLHASKGNLVESLRCCERLQERKDDSIDLGLLCHVYLLLAENHFRLDNQTAAAQHCQEALRAIDGRRGRQSPDLNLLCLAKFYKCKGKLAKSAKQFELAAQVSRRLGAVDRRGNALLEIGTIHYWLGRTRAALVPLETAADLYRRSGNLAASVDTLSLLGDAYRIMGEYDRARECLSDALRRADGIESPAAKTRALLSQAGLAVDGGDLDGAEQLLDTAEKGDRRMSTYLELKLLEHRFDVAAQRGDFGSAMDQAARGLVSTGSVDDRAASSSLLARKAMLLVDLGKRTEARRCLVMLLDVAKAYQFTLCEGRARLLEGRILLTEDKTTLAEKSLLEAADRFRGEGAERDLATLYLHHGLLSMQSGQYESAYLDFEEGFYLAKKLHLSHLKCRYYLAMGLLEFVLPEGQPARAEERLRYAEQIGQQCGYPEPLWQTRHFLRTLYEGTGRTDEAAEYATRAQEARRTLIDRIPITYRQSYLRVAIPDELDDLVGAELAPKKAVTA